ncbi:MAG: hypothetical protein ABFS41_07055 [Myxococcota bacterium]
MTTSHPTFVSYIDRTREFYAALGYGKPYQWAHHDDVPFAPLPKPLAECRVAAITTASPLGTRTDPGSLRAGKGVWSAPIDPAPERLYTDHLSWDKQATHTDDVESFLPLAALRSFAESGQIGSVAPRFHGVPTDYSQRRNVEVDAPEILRRLREDAVDVALLVPL